MERTTSIEHYLGLKIITASEDQYHEGLQETIYDTLTVGAPFCKVFTITQKDNQIKKLASLFLTIVKVSAFIRMIDRDERLTYTRVGIYPTLEAPVVIFELDAPASAYVYDRILPRPPKGMIGVIKRQIVKRTGVHPSIAALGIVVRRS